MKERKKMTRMAKRNQKLLADVLVELLNEKEFGKVTISELSRRAGVSRTMFYNYYYDIYDLVEEVENDLIDLHCIWWKRMIEQPQDVAQTLRERRETSRQLEDAYRHYKPILDLNCGKADYYERLDRRLYGIVVSDTRLMSQFEDPVMARLTTHFVNSGAVSMVRDNVENNFPISFTDMARIAMEGLQHYVEYRMPARRDDQPEEEPDQN